MPVYKCRTLISTPQDLLRVTGRVPRLSSVYPRAKALASRSEVPLRKIEREITRDPVMCAMLPRLAHIMYPALDRHAGSIADVLSILGGERIKHLLLVTAVAAAFRGIKTPQFDMRRFWRLGARRALLGRLIALEAPRVDPTRAFLAGLLGDVGHLVLHLGIPVPALDAQERAAQSGMQVHEVEMALLGFDYAQVGAVLVRRWRHCHVIENAIECQMRPLAAIDARGEACVLHIATRLAEAIESSAILASWDGSIRASVWNMVGHTHELLANIVDRANDDHEELVRALMPDVVPAGIVRLAPGRAALSPTVQRAQACAGKLLRYAPAPSGLREREAG